MRLAIAFIYLIWLGGFLLGFYWGISSTGEDGHEEKYSCTDMTDVSIKCRDEATGREWMMINEPASPLIETTALPYSEADIKYIACSFTSEGVFFCVNTRTGKIWTPAKRGVIV